MTSALRVPRGVARDSVHSGVTVAIDLNRGDEGTDGAPPSAFLASALGAGLGSKKKRGSSELPRYCSPRIVNMLGPVQSMCLAFARRVEVIHDLQENINAN